MEFRFNALCILDNLSENDLGLYVIVIEQETPKSIEIFFDDA